VANNDVVVSGIRPTGVPHLGNLRGALQQWVDLQEKYPCFYFIADWHALFGLEERSREIKENTKKVLATLLAMASFYKAFSLLLKAVLFSEYVTGLPVTLKAPKLSWISCISIWE